MGRPVDEALLEAELLEHFRPPRERPVHNLCVCVCDSEKSVSPHTLHPSCSAAAAAERNRDSLWRAPRKETTYGEGVRSSNTFAPPRERPVYNLCVNHISSLHQPRDDLCVRFRSCVRDSKKSAAAAERKGDNLWRADNLWTVNVLWPTEDNLWRGIELLEHLCPPRERFIHDL